MLLRFLKTIRAIVFARLRPIAYARSIGVKVGDGCRFISIRPSGGTFGSEPYLISIGSHVTVCGGVQFVNHDGGVWIFRNTEPDIDVFGAIVVGNNVFIGFGAIIMPGVVIGDDVVIGAGSVVVSDIPSSSVAVGAPAKVIKSKDEYRASISERVDFIRSLSKDEKRSYLERKFLF